MSQGAMGNVRLTVRVDFGAGSALGPGKIRLLEAIGATGSISQAGRALEMSYRRAWLLVDDMNHCFRTPVVATQGGGGSRRAIAHAQDRVAPPRRQRAEKADEDVDPRRHST